MKKEKRILQMKEIFEIGFHLFTAVCLRSLDFEVLNRAVLVAGDKWLHRVIPSHRDSLIYLTIPDREQFSLGEE